MTSAAVSQLVIVLIPLIVAATAYIKSQTAEGRSASNSQRLDAHDVLINGQLSDKIAAGVATGMAAAQAAQKTITDTPSSGDTTPVQGT